MTAPKFHPGSGWEPVDLNEQIDPTSERVYYQDGRGNSYVWKPKPTSGAR